MRLTTPPRERWGWEFDEPTAVQPYASPEPRWTEPPSPGLSTQSVSYQKARAKAVQHGIICGVVLVVGISLGKYGLIFDLVAIGLAGLWFLPLINGQTAASREKAEHEQHRQQAWNDFNLGLEQWRAAESQRSAQERQRVALTDKWYPVEPKAPPSRLDVFGGVPEGWSDFLVTLGAGLLAAGSRLTVVDLSEAGVAERLLTVADGAGISTAWVSLPAGPREAGMLDGLSAEAPPPALTVFRSEDATTQRRDLLDQLVVPVLIHRLRDAQPPGDVIAVAGADRLGTATLEELASSARRAGTRLVLLIEHLSEEFEPYLGGSDSVSVFMRMGNAKEAARAAEHIGRGHTFQLTQLSRTSEATTKSRVYEFTVEPTRFQDLDESGFILVEPVLGGGRRVTAGTCDPAVLTLAQVSDEPLPDERRAAREQRRSAAAAAAGPAALDEVNIADPTGRYSSLADRLATAGYQIHYEKNAEHPDLSGWLITGHRDGRPLVESEIKNHR